MNSIVVYCGANTGFHTVYAEIAYETGRLLAAKGIKLIYGGGNMGLMGRVADGGLEHGGTVIGIIPNFLAKLEVAHKTLTEVHFVETMHQRKSKMVSLSDGVIALPGGYGTLDELFEILTWGQLQIFHGPIGILNVNGFYDHLLAHLDKMRDEGFLSPESHRLLLVDTTPEGLLEKMEAFAAARPENKELDTSLYLKTPAEKR